MTENVRFPVHNTCRYKIFNIFRFQKRTIRYSLNIEQLKPDEHTEVDIYDNMQEYYRAERSGIHTTNKIRKYVEEWKVLEERGKQESPPFTKRQESLTSKYTDL